MAVDDQELLRSIEQLEARHLALARRFVGEDDAADVLQESYVRAWRARRQFRGDAALSTWLYAIVANTARSWSTRRRPTTSLDDVPEVIDAHPAADPTQRLTSANDAAALLETLAALPASLRPVAVMKLVHERSHDDIAAELGISVAATKVRLHRARRLLQLQLGQADRAA